MNGKRIYLLIYLLTSRIYLTAGFSCDVYDFQCNSGQCVYHRDRCDGMLDCNDGSDEDDCENVSCTFPDEFTCNDGRCILYHSRCDARLDCDDGSNEDNCDISICGRNHFRCSNGQCIYYKDRCNGSIDCNDGADEDDCDLSVCGPAFFRCSNGQCIDYRYRCNGSNNCIDGTDEIDCDSKTCPSHYISCPRGSCIDYAFRCDRRDNCGDGFDEESCVACSETNAFDCHNRKHFSGGGCLSPSVICDGKQDCRNNNDENFCVECSDLGFKCDHGACLTHDVRCNNNNDCGDHSDERHCSACTEPAFTCANGQIMSVEYRCDGHTDCYGGTDEVGCVKCDQEKLQLNCGGDKCLDYRFRCNGIVDCWNGTDERNCECPASDFTCGNGSCLPIKHTCDGTHDCTDESDEKTMLCLFSNMFVIGLSTGGTILFIICLTVTIVCVKNKLLNKRRAKKPRTRRSRPAARRAAARNDTEAQFYEETTFASGTRNQLSDNYASMVRDPYGYADLWLEGDVHLPADSYDDVRVDNYQMVFEAYDGSFPRNPKRRQSTAEQYYLTMLSSKNDVASQGRTKLNQSLSMGDLMRSKTKGGHLNRSDDMPIPESSKDPYYLTVLPTPGYLSLESDNGQQPTDLLLREKKGGAQMKRSSEMEPDFMTKLPSTTDAQVEYKSTEEVLPLSKEDELQNNPRQQKERSAKGHLSKTTKSPINLTAIKTPSVLPFERSANFDQPMSKTSMRLKNIKGEQLERSYKRSFNPKGPHHLTIQPAASATRERNANDNELMSKTNMLLNTVKGDNLKQADMNKTKEKQLTQSDSMSELTEGAVQKEPYMTMTPTSDGDRGKKIPNIRHPMSKTSMLKPKSKESTESGNMPLKPGLLRQNLALLPTVSDFHGARITKVNQPMDMADIVKPKKKQSTRDESMPLREPTLDP